MLCSVESSEIDLSEFQEENRDDGNGGGDGNGSGDGNEGTGQDDAQPSNATAEPASGNVGEIITPSLLKNCYLFELLHRQLICSY